MVLFTTESLCIDECNSLEEGCIIYVELDGYVSLGLLRSRCQYEIKD